MSEQDIITEEQYTTATPPKRFYWSSNLQEEFVSSVFDVGLKKSTPGWFLFNYLY